MKRNFSTTMPLAAFAAGLIGATLVWGADDEQSKQAGKANLQRASQLIGLNLKNTAGETLGEIHDLAVDINNASVPFVIVSHGGVAGVGGDLTAMPWKAIRYANGQQPSATIDMTKDRLEQAPEFTSDNWTKLNDRTWTGQFYEYHSVKTADGERTTIARGEIKPVSIVQGSDVVGMDLHNRQNEDLGEIEDFMIDANTGRIGYAVLSFGGVLGIGEKLFAVPWQSLSMNAERNQFVINADKNKLKNAPGFDKNNWPDMADLRWSKDVHEFYGSDPNWIYGYSGGDNNQAAKGWGVNDAYNKKFNKNSVQTVKGFVTDVGNVAPMDGMSEAATITVQTDGNESFVVHLGPSWFMQNQDRQFNDGEQVEVTGCRADFNGQQAIMAVEIKRGEETLKLRDKDGRPAWMAWHTDND
jgi:sporulation protein YlmC with PRC-barrel domain